MTINTKELQRFYDVWGPMIASLPAVINAAESSAELESQVVRLRAEANAAIEATEKALKDRKTGFAAIELQKQELTEKAREQAQAVKNHAKDCDERIKSVQAEAESAIAYHAARAALARTDADGVESILRTKLAEVDAEVAMKREAELAKLTDATAELEAIEKRKASAEKALDSLRAKLG